MQKNQIVAIIAVVGYLWLGDLRIVVLMGTVAAGIAWIVSGTIHSFQHDMNRLAQDLDGLLKKHYDLQARSSNCCHETDTITRKLAKVARRLRKRDRQKSKYTKKLKHLTQQQSEIISAISHEFKNPIAAIIGYAGTIHDDPDLSPELREKFLEKVIRNGERISEMIDRLSLAIKMENHTLEAKKVPFDFAVLLDEVVDNLRQKYPDRTLTVSSEASPIYADRVMMAQAISNLIDNALKYSEKPVSVTLKGGRFTVEDHGTGIEADAIDKITQRFYRADTQSWDNSLGVGLSIVAYILKLHNTHLQIESTLMKGSSFGFSLPDGNPMQAPTSPV